MTAATAPMRTFGVQRQAKRSLALWRFAWGAEIAQQQGAALLDAHGRRTTNIDEARAAKCTACSDVIDLADGGETMRAHPSTHETIEPTRHRARGGPPLTLAILRALPIVWARSERPALVEDEPDD